MNEHEKNAHGVAEKLADFTVLLKLLSREQAVALIERIEESDIFKADEVQCTEQGARITLKYPIKVSGETVTEINMRRAKVKDVRASQAAGDAAANEVHLFARLSELTFDQVDDLYMCDHNSLQEAYKRFLS